MAPFFGEVRVDPRAEPGLFLAPLQALGQEHLTDPAAPHANPLLTEIGDQAIQGPRGEGQAQLRRPAQGGLDHHAPLLGRVGWRPSRAHVLFQPLQAALVELLEPEPNRGTAQTHPGGDLRCAQALLHRVPHDRARRTRPAPSVRERAIRATSSASSSPNARTRRIMAMLPSRTKPCLNALRTEKP